MSYGSTVVLLLVPLHPAHSSDFLDSDSVLFRKDVTRLKSVQDYGAAIARLDLYIDGRMQQAFAFDILLASAIRERSALQRMTGDHTTTLTLLWRAISIDIEALGRDHPVVAYDYLALGDALAVENEPDEAQTFYRQALIVLTSSLGSSNASTEIAFRRLAQALGPRK